MQITHWQIWRSAHMALCQDALLGFPCLHRPNGFTELKLAPHHLITEGHGCGFAVSLDSATANAEM